MTTTHSSHSTFTSGTSGADTPGAALEAFTARMHEVLSSYLASAAARWPEALGAALHARNPGFALGTALSAAPAQHLAEACCTLRLPGGMLALSVYAAEAADLSAPEREALLAFQRPLPGMVFEVTAVRGLCLHVLAGRARIAVRTPPKPFPLEAFVGRGALILCKLVPLRESYTHLGPLQVIRAQDRPHLARSLQRQLREQMQRGEEPVLRFLGVSGFGEHS